MFLTSDPGGKENEVKEEKKKKKEEEEEEEEEGTEKEEKLVTMSSEIGLGCHFKKRFPVDVQINSFYQLECCYEVTSVLPVVEGIEVQGRQALLVREVVEAMNSLCSTPLYAFKDIYILPKTRPPSLYRIF
ncbi:hypothetical protein SprV_0902697900 [Sparganum proliferum]